MTYEDVIEFCEEQDVRFIRLSYFDIYGIQKNVSVLPSELKRAFTEGISFDASAIDGFLDEVNSDLFLYPDPNTMSILPWRSMDGSVIRMYCDIKYPDGTPFERDVRYILKKAVNKAKEMGISVNFGSEFEFYLFKQDENGENTYIPLDQAGYMDIAPLDKGENVRREICLTLSEMGIDPEVSHHEMGHGQNEIDFRYSSALQAADNAATFKWVVQAIANMQGLVADFSPKPINDQPGNGMHINMSVENHEELMMPFMAGILNRTEEMTLFLNPIKDSYKRLGKDKAPQYISWSYQNRNQLIRIPATHSTSRIELRSPDCSCNIYLAYALLICAGLEGIEKKLETIPCTDVTTNDLKRLPQDLKEAKRKASESEWLRNILGKDVVDIYVG
ncbi:glutamine synthetase [Eubacterium sp. AF22-8LB]|uniref:glutamine synthetase family protein n=1 Tax=Eubacterium sp. AF22-8LB TaxID=2292232 RepID=UPI000E53C94A|nr:glutamine synthetase family protein [Eubacterium sp. AF22-8LB]RGS32180.1 glutamine synthetase [Eubacterium sp. AF22-8LB]